MHIEIKQKIQLYQTLTNMKGVDGLRQSKIRLLIEKSSIESLNISKFTIIKKTKQFLKIIKLNRSYLNDRELLSTIITIRNSYRKIQNSSKQIQYLVNKIQQQEPQQFKKLEKQLQKSKQGCQVITKIKKNQQQQDENKKMQNKINLTIKNILTKSTMVNDPQCSGCIKYFQQGKLYQFSNTSHSLIFLNLSSFSNQEFLTDHLCALLNSKHSTIFVTDFMQQNSSYLIEGLSLDHSKKAQYQSYIIKCLKYIQPKAQLNQDIYVQYIPLVKYQQTQEYKEVLIKDKCVMKIIFKKNRNKTISYVIYKLNANKKLDYGFFCIKHNKLSCIQIKTLYKEIHNNYKINKHYLQQGATNKKIDCQYPLPINFSEDSSLKQQEQKKIQSNIKNQPLKTKKTGITKYQMKLQSKFKYSLLIMRNKLGTKQQKTILEIEKDLANQKILCSLQKILPQIGKYHFWVLSYDCSGKFVQSVIKSHNKNGQYTVLRPKKSIKVTDEEFLNQKKQRIFVQTFRQMGGSVKQCKDIDLNSLTSGKKNNYIMFNFKSIKDSIFGFGLLQVMAHRVQFFKQQ